MNTVHVLDCTLRDGGYCNQWTFGFEGIKKISNSLVNANVDIVECGFLKNNVAYNPDATLFRNISDIKAVIPQNRDGKIFVVMINYGEYDPEELPERDSSTVDGIRVAFHKKNKREALEFCEKIKKKGYLVFVQAMVSLSYSDEEFLALIKSVNDIEPYAFYIVDSFGMMSRKNLFRLFYMVENNLNNMIWIGFHSHNNMQLAYSNAQALVDVQTNRNLIIDSSIYGMGRGAGNLNTELFVDYLNENVDGRYNLKPLLNVIDEILNDFYQQNYWGYSLPNYLSACHWVHPNYAEFLSEKNTLTVEAIDEIFSLIPVEKKFEYDRDFAEEIYIQYMDTGRLHEEHKSELLEKLQGKTVLLIAPGKSSDYERDKICEFASGDSVITVSVNFIYPLIETDYVFLSNLRRFREFDKAMRYKCIVTSNIPADGVFLQTDYYDLLMADSTVKDNAGLMAIKFMINHNVKNIYLAGFDGYSHDVDENYASHSMTLITKKAMIDALNIGMKNGILELKKYANINFLTKQRYFQEEV